MARSLIDHLDRPLPRRAKRVPQHIDSVGGVVGRGYTQEEAETLTRQINIQMQVLTHARVVVGWKTRSVEDEDGLTVWLDFSFDHDLSNPGENSFAVIDVVHTFLRAKGVQYRYSDYSAIPTTEGN